MWGIREREKKFLSHHEERKRRAGEEEILIFPLLHFSRTRKIKRKNFGPFLEQEREKRDTAAVCGKTWTAATAVVLSTCRDIIGQVFFLLFSHNTPTFFFFPCGADFLLFAVPPYICFLPLPAKTRKRRESFRGKKRREKSAGKVRIMHAHTYLHSFAVTRRGGRGGGMLHWRRPDAMLSFLSSPSYVFTQRFVAERRKQPYVPKIPLPCLCFILRDMEK